MQESVPTMPGLVAQGTLIEAAARMIRVRAFIPGQGMIEGYVAGLDESYVLLFAPDLAVQSQWSVYIVSRLYLMWVASSASTLEYEDPAVQEQYLKIAEGFLKQAQEILRRFTNDKITEGDGE